MSIVLHITWFSILCAGIAYFIYAGTPWSVLASTPRAVASATPDMVKALFLVVALPLFAIGTVLAIITLPLWLMSWL
jgi:hypothetical protein